MQSKVKCFPTPPCPPFLEVQFILTSCSTDRSSLGSRRKDSNSLFSSSLPLIILPCFRARPTNWNTRSNHSNFDLPMPMRLHQEDLIRRAKPLSSVTKAIRRRTTRTSSLPSNKLQTVKNHPTTSSVRGRQRVLKCSSTKCLIKVRNRNPSSTHLQRRAPENPNVPDAVTTVWFLGSKDTKGTAATETALVRNVTSSQKGRGSWQLKWLSNDSKLPKMSWP